MYNELCVIWELTFTLKYANRKSGMIQCTRWTKIRRSGNSGSVCIIISVVKTPDALNYWNVVIFHFVLYIICVQIGSVCTYAGTNSGRRSTGSTDIPVFRGKMFNTRRIVCHRKRNMFVFSASNFSTTQLQTKIKIL